MIMLAGGKHTETYAQRAEESAPQENGSFDCAPMALRSGRQRKPTTFPPSTRPSARAEESVLTFSKTGKLSVKENVENPYFTGNNLDLEGDIWYHCGEIIPCRRNPIHILENSHSRAPQPAMFAA